ncbi:MAG: flagellar hook-basal body complex protein FliE [Deltaproteobacteria bacterium]|nr:flagellar hook-basal body complex protein FliE [Deltaproteobacteria bacterium]
MSIVLSPQGLSEVVPLKPQSTAPTSKSGFGEILVQANQILARADSTAAEFAQGKVGLTEAVLASERADTTFQVLMAIRNRALAAYQEVMNMQV